MSDLRIEILTFREADRQRWRSGNDDMLEKSRASPFLKRVLAKKHLVRPTRFFGEAFVASHMSHDEGYYCPFKWLTSRAWADPSDLQATDGRNSSGLLRGISPNSATFKPKRRRLRRLSEAPSRSGRICGWS